MIFACTVPTVGAILEFFARACPEPVDGVGGDASSTRAARLEIGKGTSSLVPINDPFEDPASAAEVSGIDGTVSNSLSWKLEYAPFAPDCPQDLSS
jgi:hypothetical protein